MITEEMMADSKQGSNDPTWPTLATAGVASVALFASGVSAMLGVLSVPVVGLITAGLSWIVFRIAPKNVAVRGGHTSAVAWIMLFSIVAAWTVWNGAHASELVITGRDGATYLSIARGLVADGDLLPEVTDTFIGSVDYEFETPGWIIRDDGRLYQQFLHATPAMWAAVARLLGTGALFWSNAVVGAMALLAYFSLVRRWLTQWIAMGATVTIAACLPMIYYSRSTFTEPAALMVLALGLWLASEGLGRSSRSISMLSGAILGLGAMVRIDGWLIGVALAWTLVMDQIWGKERTAPTRDVWLGFLATGSIGLIDLLVFATPYLQMHRSQMLALFVAILIGRAATMPVFAPLRALLAKLIVDARPRSYRLIGLVVGSFTLFVFVIRPLFTVSYGGGYGLQAIEAVEGLQVASGRNYNELIGWWQIWYLGAAVIGAALLVMVIGAWRGAVLHDAGGRLVAMLVAVPAVLYLLKPSANPDHLWVMRRYLPTTLPMFTALAWYGLQWLRSRLEAPAVRRIGGLAAGTALAISPLSATLPMASVTDGAGGVTMIEHLCEQIGNAPVLLVQDQAQLDTFVMQPIRVFCGLPVATVSAGDLDRALDELSGPVTVVTAEPEVLVDQDVELLIATQITYIQETLLSVPNDVREAPVELFTVESTEDTRNE